MLVGYDEIQLVKLYLERRQPCLGHLHIMRIMPTAYTDTADHAGIRHNRIAAAEDDQAIGFDDAVQQWWIILHELVPLVCRHAKANCGKGFVLRDLHA